MKRAGGSGSRLRGLIERPLRGLPLARTGAREHPVPLAHPRSLCRHRNHTSVRRNRGGVLAFTHVQAETSAKVLANPDASALATKLDLQVLKTDFERALHRQTWGLIGVMFAQGAFIVAVLQLLS